MKQLIVALALMLAATQAVTAAAPSWEQARGTEARELQDRSEGEQIDIRVKDGYLYITTNAEVSVKVFSILGQLISSQTVPVGTYRLHMPARGIYILKVGTTITRRVTV